MIEYYFTSRSFFNHIPEYCRKCTDLVRKEKKKKERRKNIFTKQYYLNLGLKKKIYTLILKLFYWEQLPGQELSDIQALLERQHLGHSWSVLSSRQVCSLAADPAEDAQLGRPCALSTFLLFTVSHQLRGDKFCPSDTEGRNTDCSADTLYKPIHGPCCKNKGSETMSGS